MGSFRILALNFAVLILITAVSAGSWRVVRRYNFELKNAKGESVGTATLQAAGKGVKIHLNLKNLTPVNMPCIFTRTRSAKRQTLSLRGRISIRTGRNTGCKTRMARTLAT